MLVRILKYPDISRPITIFSAKIKDVDCCNSKYRCIKKSTKITVLLAVLAIIMFVVGVTAGNYNPLSQAIELY